MWYMISAQDVENSLEKRLAARPAHLARLQELADEGGAEQQRGEQVQAHAPIVRSPCGARS